MDHRTPTAYDQAAADLACASSAIASARFVEVAKDAPSRPREELTLEIAECAGTRMSPARTPTRRALQVLDSNCQRPTAAVDAAAADAKGFVLAVAVKTNSPALLQALPVLPVKAPPIEPANASSCAESEPRLSQAEQASQGAQGKAVSVARKEDDVSYRENIAWLDMLVALMERKYKSHQLPVCIEELEAANMLESYWKRPSGDIVPEGASENCTKRRRLDAKSEHHDSAMLPKSTPFGESIPLQLFPDVRFEKGTKRQHTLRRHALQIQEASVASSSCCGCKSGCLKMYCACFSTRGYCHAGCSCQLCKNTRDNSQERVDAIHKYLSDDPRAFSFASQQAAAMGFYHLLPEKSSSVILRGCRCKKSKCLKKYCECFQNGLGCSPHCRCVDCANDESANARSLRAHNKSDQQNQHAFHRIQLLVTKKPRRNLVHKSVRVHL